MRVSACLVTIVVVAVGSAWAQPPEPTDPLARLPKEVREEIDSAQVLDLLNDVARVEKALSRKGQVWLRDQAQIQRIRDLALAIKKQFADNPRMAMLEEKLQGDAFQRELAALIDTPEKELPAKFTEFLDSQNVTQNELAEYRDLQEAIEAEKVSTEILAKIEAQLKSVRIPELPGFSGSGGRGLLQRLKEIGDRIEGQPAADDDPTTVEANTGDVKELLRSLLGKKASGEKP